MIPKIILGKGPEATRRTIGYLFGKGRANEHIDPHLVASWNDFAPDPGRSPHRDPKEVEAQLAAQLDQPVKMLGDKAPKYTVWHCPVRAAPEDPLLTDAQWADIARRIVAAAGIAPQGDDEACRWVAVRHADDHIHIAATLVRQDGRRPQRDYDQRAVQREARQIEVDYGLRRLKPGDGTAAKRPTSKEHFKAKRLGQDATSREILRLRVRRAVAAAADEAEFFALLEATGVSVRLKRGPSGDALGCNFALPGDTNDKGAPVFYSGSTLAPDLSLPQIRRRLATTSPEPATVQPGNPWHQATAATERIPHHLTHGDDPTGQGQWSRSAPHWTSCRSPHRPPSRPNSNRPLPSSSAPPAPASPRTWTAVASCAAASRRSGGRGPRTVTGPDSRCSWTQCSPRWRSRCTGTAPASTPSSRRRPSRPLSTCRPRMRRSPARS